MSTASHNIEQPTSFVFSEETLEKAKAVIAKYPEGRQQSAVMPLLDLAQRQNDNWLPVAAMDYVADLLKMPPMKVYEVAHFYTMYNTKPVGKNHVQVCTNISCFLRGSDKIIAACKDTLGIGLGQTTEDGEFTLSEVECLGACVNAPMIQVNDDFYEDLTEDSTKAVLEALKKGEQPKTGPQGDRQGCQPAGGLTSLKEGS